MLAPVNAILPVPDTVSTYSAALAEPLAAALQGVESTGPQEGDNVAVLGPRRLGMLVIAALAGYRKREGINFSISAIVRHTSLEDLA